MKEPHCAEGQRLSELLAAKTIELNKAEAEKRSSVGVVAGVDEEKWQEVSRRSADAKAAYNLVFWEHMHHIKSCPFCGRSKQVD